MAKVNIDEMEDPYADPSDSQSSSSSDSDGDLWSAWDEKNKGKASGEDSRNDSYSQQDSRIGIMGGKDRKQGARFGESSSFGRTDGFGRKKDPSSYSSGLNLQDSRTRTYGSDPSQGYQPYKGSYEKQQQPQQEFKRPDSYQQWKERNKTDPYQ